MLIPKAVMGFFQIVKYEILLLLTPLFIPLINKPFVEKRKTALFRKILESEISKRKLFRFFTIKAPHECLDKVKE